jgi:hypothetical protein
MLTRRQSAVGSWHVIHEWHDTYLYLSEPTEDCLIVNLISTGMYHAIHGSHVSGTDRRLSSSQHDKYRYVSYQTIFCRFLTCDPWMAWYIPVLIMLTIRQSSVGSWDMWSMNGMIHTCTFMDHMSETDRRLSSSQHDKYRYVSCHSWITCQEPTEDCLIVNMISTGMYTYHVDYKTIFCPFLRHVIHEWHDTYLYLSCWLEENLLSVPDMWSMNDTTW